MTTLTTLTTRIALALATFSFAGLIHSSTAEAAPAERQERGAGKGERMCARLACSPDQKAKIQQIKASKAPQVKAAREQMRTLRAQVQAELRKPSPDAKAFARLDAQIDAQRAAIHSQRRAGQLQLLALLTPEQKTKLLAAADQRRNKGHGHGKRGGHGQRRGDGKGRGPARAN